MSFRGLNYQTIQLPLAAGRNAKADPRALDVPALAELEDAQFDEHGGLEARYPFTTLSSSLANIRRIVANGDELLAFTETELYTWDAGASTWRSRGTHLAVKVEEASRFVTTGDQIDCDRAELSGVIIFAWQDGTTVYYAAIDSTTGAVKLAPTSITTAYRPRLVALDSVILLFCIVQNGADTDLTVRSITPSTLAVSAATTLIAQATRLDAMKVPGADTAAFATARQVTSSYTVGTVTADLTTNTLTKARTCNGPIAVSCEPTGVRAQIVRANGTNVQGDLLTLSTLADVYTNQAVGTVGTAVAQIAAAHRSVEDSGVYRCYAFWSDTEDTEYSDWSSYSNWVSTGNTLGTAARFVRALGIASRAFDHDGRVFFWGVFGGTSAAVPAFGDVQAGGQLQNSYYLYRDDAHLTAKAAAGRAGGHISSSGSTGLLPSVQRRPLNENEYAWSGTERRIVPLGNEQRSYADRGPREIRFEFDSNEARRCVRLGGTLYIAGGEIRQYDGVRITEVGFHVYPWVLTAVSLGGTGLAAGDYFYRSTLRWDNAAGELDRSTTATTMEVSLAAPGDMSLTQVPLYITHKTDSAPAIEWWRTPVNPDGDADYYLVTKKDPASTSNPNRYLANDTTVDLTPTVEDSFSDDELREGELYPEALAELENLAPPPATVIAASADRIFLGNVAGDPDRVWYSKQRHAGRVASFHDVLTIDVPHQGGEITALAFLSDTLVVFRERAIYMLPGDGLDNTGGGQNYGPARTIATDVGAASAEAVGSTPEGIIFKSSKGWHLLDRGWSVKYIGGPVADRDGDTALSVHVNESRHQIRCATSGAMLVFDYLVGQWAIWNVPPASTTGAAMWRGTHVIADVSAVYTEHEGYTNLDYALLVETPWIKPAQLQGYARIRKMLLLGEYRSAHALKVQVAYDYDETWVDEKVWTVSPTTVGGPLQVAVFPSRQQCQAIKLRIQPQVSDVDASAPTGEALKLTGLALEVGVMPGLFRRIPSTQRT